MATGIDIPVDQGSDITYSFQAFQVDGTPFPLTGANITLTAKVSETDPATALELSTQTGEIAITDAANGIWNVSFPASKTAALPAGVLVYQQQSLFTTGKTYRLCEGSIYISQQVAPT